MTPTKSRSIAQNPEDFQIENVLESTNRLSNPRAIYSNPQSRDNNSNPRVILERNLNFIYQY